MLNSLLSTYAQNYTFCILCSSRSLLIFLTVIVMYRLVGLYNSILPDPASRLRGRAQRVVLGTPFLELILAAPSYGYITLFPILVPLHDNCINNILYITPNVAVSGRWAAEGMCSSNRWAMTWAAWARSWDTSYISFNHRVYNSILTRTKYQERATTTRWGYTALHRQLI